MPEADKIQWPQGEPQFENHWRAITEALAGNGVVGNGDFEVTATVNDMEIEVSTGTAFYTGSTYSLTATESHTLSSADSTNDRWDTVYFDTSTATSGVRDGIAEVNPEPPDIQGDEILLATVYVPATATDIPDAQILNWRTHSNDADTTYLKDSANDYNGETVEEAFTQVIREGGDPLEGPLDLSSFSGSAPLDLGENPGIFGAIVDMTVNDDSPEGTVHSYDMKIDGKPLLELRAESDGTGGVKNLEARFSVPTNIGLSDLANYDLNGANLIDTGMVIYDATEDRIVANVNADTIIAESKLNIPVLGSDPSNPDAGDDWIDQNSGIRKWYDGNIIKASGRDH